MPLPAAHRATTAHLRAAYPFMAESGLGPRGVYVGRDVYGGAFCYDPWELYRAGILLDPNMLVAGTVGSAKSSLIKSYIWRQSIFGRRAVVQSPKPGEYDALAAAFGVTPLSLYPGGLLRLNPLDAVLAPPGDETGHGERSRAAMLVALAEAAVGRALEPEEVSACTVALTASRPEPGADVLTLPAVVDALLRPSAEAAATIAATPERLADDARKVGHALRRLVLGDLAGMFDAPTSPSVRLGGPLTVLDLSRMYDSPALGIVMLCATAWQSAALSRADAAKWISVSDEAWATLRHPAVASGMQQAWKLARSYGVQNIAIIHRLSDLEAAGEAGSQTRALAQGLLEDTGTRVVLHQSPGELHAAVGLLGLTEAEAALLPSLPRARALWKVGGRSFLVDHRLARGEWSLVDTDSGMRQQAVR